MAETSSVHRSRLLMSGHALVTVGDYHPKLDAGYVSSVGGGSGFNITATIADNSINAGEAAVIHSIHVDGDTTSNIVIHDSVDGLMADDAIALSATTGVHGSDFVGPVYFANGFHVEVIGTGGAIFSIVYSIVADAD